MVHTLRRHLVAVVALALVAGLVGGAALAASGNGRIVHRQTVRGGFGPFGGGFVVGGPGFGFAFGGPGPVMRGGGPGPFGIAVGGPGMVKVAGGAGVLTADTLTPAASFLGIPLSTLTADLKGGKTLAQEATAKGKTADDLITAIVAAEQKVLDNENAAGWITDAQETAILADFKDGVTELVNAGPPVPPSGGPQAGGPLQAAATYIGISVSDLTTALQSGKTLAQVATDNGKTVDGLVSALVAPAKTKLDAQVTAGNITAAQEQTILTNVTTRVTDFVNNAKPGSSTKMTTRLTALLRR
jgi:hypothetical protein